MKAGARSRRVRDTFT